MRITIVMLDPDGLPRAWGSANTYGFALREADRQLNLYRNEKRAVGDPLADAKFTTRLLEVES